LDEDQAPPIESESGVETARVIDNIELMPLGDKLNIASMELHFRDGILIKVQRLPARVIETKDLKVVARAV
jgi:hypothetical protein